VSSVLAQALQAMAPPTIVLGCRTITIGDELALAPDEARSITATLMPARRASGAARIVARELLSRLGVPCAAIPKSPSGQPLWPAGVTGSLAHDDTIAAAAVARLRDISALGIDVEPAAPLPPDVLSLVARPEELAGLPGQPCAGRIVFAAKEAVYKALHPLDGVPLEYEDIHVDLRRGQATTRTDRVVQLRYVVSTRIVTLAFVEAPNGGMASPRRAI
jgi:4'-phosphopantetheinyl transferase EntD